MAERLAKACAGDAGLVRERIGDALLALGAVTGGELTERDLDRFLDLLVLSRQGT